MKNFICTGERIDIVAPVGGLVAGQPYVIGAKVVVIVSGGLAGELVSAATEGVFEIPKAVGAVAIGAAIYWDDTAKVITTVVPGNIKIGFAYKASLSGDATGFVCVCDNPGVTQAAKVATSATADGSDPATTQALANALKVKVNAIITALTDAGLMANA